MSKSYHTQSMRKSCVHEITLSSCSNFGNNAPI